MGNRTYKRVFRNKPELLQEMLDLRKQGWSFPRLGVKYGVDYSSIIYQVKKHGDKVKQELLKRKSKKTTKETTKERYRAAHIPQIMKQDIELVIEKINQGKNYADYLKEKKMQLVNCEGWMM